ncbi:hypothetical protein CF326_g4953, partial [Tilletia indica]
MPGLKAEPKYVHTIIIGCGVSGIATAALLKRNEDVHTFERYSGAGGVWFINKYPGASYSVILDNGDEVPADVVVLATGFSIREGGGVLKIFGRDGVRDINTYLSQEYKDPSTYRSTMITDFPNLFMVMTGFNSTTGHSGIVYTAECQIDWMIRTGRDLFNERSRPSKAELVLGGETESAGVGAAGSRKRFPLRLSLSARRRSTRCSGSRRRCRTSFSL